VCCVDFEILKLLGRNLVNGVRNCRRVHVRSGHIPKPTGGRKRGSAQRRLQRCVPAQKSAQCTAKLNSSAQICWAAGARDLIREVHNLWTGVQSLLRRQARS
jgi:hypothetical protein